MGWPQKRLSLLLTVTPRIVIIIQVFFMQLQCAAQGKDLEHSVDYITHHQLAALVSDKFKRTNKLSTIGSLAVYVGVGSLVCTERFSPGTQVPPLL